MTSLHIPKGVLELSLHRLDIRILDEELGAELAELGKLDLPAPVLIDLLEDLHELLLAGPEAHRAQDLVQIVGREELLLLRVEQIEAGLQALDLIGLEGRRLVNLFEIDAGIGIRLAGHVVG